ncbi:hypothetical protein [Teredinibacter sp. KSP-S5-2]|uniref:hypothetical protein n=1 Tax=Teredinibacter sp. KSP-S5-2 TaxID=3034506 RepID=UPI0029345B30|nr:hypothetical protein [Teredinibacter sp. KSP-S5-2]WNO10871.1 hypothetical protein P5V12_06745 [Teredinibacter sp. KSP-S5-2]
MNGFETLKQRLGYFEGVHECHITVDIQPSEVEAFCHFCQHLGGDATVIELSNGHTPVQPMLGKIISPYEGETYEQILHLYNVLKVRYRILRVKVEAGLENKNIPLLDDENRSLPDTCYFEHHVKMQLRLDANLDDIRMQLKKYNAHLSNNALTVNKENQYRFATQRFDDIGKYNAGAKLQELLGFLSEKNIPACKVIREFNIYDSNKDLDAGWL